MNYIIHEIISMKSHLLKLNMLYLSINFDWPVPKFHPIFYWTSEN